MRDLKSKMKMPKKKGPEMEAELDLDMLGDELMAEESPEMSEEDTMMADMESPEEMPSELEAIADEDLIAEMKKRGLSLPEEEAEEPSDEDMLESEDEMLA